MYFMSIPNVWYQDICTLFSMVYDDTEDKQVKQVFCRGYNLYLIRYIDGTEKEATSYYVLSVREN
jgi:hypothetical protein